MSDTLLVTGITNFRCKKGVMELKFSKPAKESFEYRFEKPTELFATSNPTMMSPYERKHVYVQQSGIVGAGEGLFAKTRFEKGDLISIYAGKVNKFGISSNWKKSI